jgi:hypothetical protein
MILKLAADGTLVDTEGEVFGKLVSIELDILDRGGTVSERSERYGNSVPLEVRSAYNVKGLKSASHQKETENVKGVKPNVKVNVKDENVNDEDKKVNVKDENVNDEDKEVNDEGQNVNVKVKKGAGEEKKTDGLQQISAESEAIGRVWAYYLELIPSRKKLDDKRRRFIRQALRLLKDIYECELSEAERLVKLAVLGLSRSPHHRGKNEQHKQYLEIRYALKGIGNESDDSRIEKAISWAALYAPEHSQLDRAKVERYLEYVRYTLSFPHRPERERAKKAYRELRDAGYRVISMDKSPWARLER